MEVLDYNLTEQSVNNVLYRRKWQHLLKCTLCFASRKWNKYYLPVLAWDNWGTEQACTSLVSERTMSRSRNSTPSTLTVDCQCVYKSHLYTWFIEVKYYWTKLHCLRGTYKNSVANQKAVQVWHLVECWFVVLLCKVAVIGTWCCHQLDCLKAGKRLKGNALVSTLFCWCWL